ncbi:hypothetical protein [Kitasatospora sp. NPDC051164]|uniref:hypothetical protein n=1 Tax=Kitasatospora sp. NPDC051164 TaxID=3364055 RepID=UPI003790C0D2
MSWWQQPLVGFDLETTGTDPAVERIVTAALVDTVGAARVSHGEARRRPAAHAGTRAA